MPDGNQKSLQVIVLYAFAMCLIIEYRFEMAICDLWIGHVLTLDHYSAGA
jgi:hypothetical protein